MTGRDRTGQYRKDRQYKTFFLSSVMDVDKSAGKGRGNEDGQAAMERDMTEIVVTATAGAREMVRRVLFEPLDGLGLVRGRNLGAAVWTAERGQLAGRLAYLTEVELVALREGVLELAQRTGGAWPRGVHILQLAHALRRPPPSFSEKVTSYMASAAGRRALAEGYAGVLLSWLRDHPGVPTAYVLDTLRGQALDERRELDRLVARRELGVALCAEDVARLAAHARREEVARALVETTPGGREVAS